jgi:hypothetical protein
LEGKATHQQHFDYGSLIRGPVATVGSVGVEGAECGEERKEVELKD